MNTPSTSELFEFLRFQSISADPVYAPQMKACAEWLDRKFQRMGLESRVYPTAGHPIVLARTKPVAGRRTLLIYGHYDVQPVDPLDEWNTPPFEPTVKNGVVFARGATDNKGQIFSHILGVEKTLLEKGELPVNVIFLVEGEEETGCENLGTFLEKHREELQCDAVALSDTGMVARGLPSLTYGLRGILAMDIRLHGAESDLHSGIYGGVAPNPATLLARMIASLHDTNFRVAIPGFYDAVVELQDWERKEWARLPLTDDFLKKAIHSPALLGEAGYTAVERAWGRPTAEVNGIGGGYQGQGSKTVIPRESFAKLTFRLVPNQTPADIEAKVRAHFERICPPQIRLEMITGHGGNPLLCDPHSPNGQAARRALTRTWGVEPALIREGGSIPIMETFQNTLGVEILLLGLALPDANCHAPNENFPLENFEAGIRLNQALLEEFANV